MLSTFAARKGPAKAFSVLRPMFLVRNTTTAAVKKDGEPNYPHEDEFPSSVQPELSMEEKVKYWRQANEIFFGPQRDMKNFPSLEIPEKIERDYNFFVIPTDWFKQLYPRLGVSGCYSVLGLSIMFGLNKEFILPDSNFGEIVCWSAVMLGIIKWRGDKIGAFLDKESDRMVDENYTKPLNAAKSRYSVEVDTLNSDIESQSAVPTIFEAKKEQVDLQLELQYRERMSEIFNTVKSRLDYQADIEAAHRKFEQDLMVNWIVNSVEKAITPQQEKESIASCITTLKNLSKTAAL